MPSSQRFGVRQAHPGEVPSSELLALLPCAKPVMHNECAVSLHYVPTTEDQSEREIALLAANGAQATPESSIEVADLEDSVRANRHPCTNAARTTLAKRSAYQQVAPTAVRRDEPGLLIMWCCHDVAEDHCDVGLADECFVHVHGPVTRHGAVVVGEQQCLGGRSIDSVGACRTDTSSWYPLVVDPSVVDEALECSFGFLVVALVDDQHPHVDADGIEHRLNGWHDPSAAATRADGDRDLRTPSGFRTRGTQHGVEIASSGLMGVEVLKA